MKVPGIVLLPIHCISRVGFGVYRPTNGQTKISWITYNNLNERRKVKPEKISYINGAKQENCYFCNKKTPQRHTLPHHNHKRSCLSIIFFITFICFVQTCIFMCFLLTNFRINVMKFMIGVLLFIQLGKTQL